jgi:hypothetical protein
VVRRFNTASWWRSTRISTSLAPGERASSTIQLTRRERIRYVHDPAPAPVRARRAGGRGS